MMLIGKLDSVTSDSIFITLAIRKALSFLRNCEFQQLANGRHEIDGDNIFMIISEYQTTQPKNKKAEQHRKYIDIHYLISGKEMIRIGFENSKNIPNGTYNPENDCAMFTKVEDEVFIPMLPGMYIVLFPEEIHRPGLHYMGKPQKVRKAVVKLSMEMLK
ncbi:YhcH/YjgK/YiaL family protein [Candidatus Woesearchaeota archaeon]|nr:YhcH/YjgK/YiaL family protein [Candidatus Woesearchaeota archaeon]